MYDGIQYECFRVTKNCEYLKIYIYKRGFYFILFIYLIGGISNLEQKKKKEKKKEKRDILIISMHQCPNSISSYTLNPFSKPHQALGWDA